VSSNVFKKKEVKKIRNIEGTQSPTVQLVLSFVRLRQN